MLRAAGRSFFIADGAKFAFMPAMELGDPGLENVLVRMEPLGSEHRETLHASGAVDAMWKWMPVMSTGTNYDSYFDHTLLSDKLGNSTTFAVFSAVTGDFLGVAAFLDPNRTHRRIQIANLWLVPDARGKGIFSAVQALMIQRALDWGARRIVWLADERNDASKGALRKLGAIEEGLAREYQRMSDGHWANMVVFSLLRPEAKATVERLTADLAERAAVD